MENTFEDTFHLWAKYLLHPWCCRCQRLAHCWEGCEECLDGWMLTELNRHHRTLLQEYVRSVKGSCSSCWDDNSSLRWRAYDWRGSDWWRTRWVGRQWLLTRWEASRWDEEACYYDGIAVEDERGQPAMSHTGDPWTFHTLARTTRRSAQ